MLTSQCSFLLPGLWLGVSACNMLSSVMQPWHRAMIAALMKTLEARALTCTSEHTARAHNACGNTPVLDQHENLAVARYRDQSKPAAMGLMPKKN